MLFYSKRLRRILKSVPGQRFGLYRFLPFFFCAGALLEYCMINWRAFGKVNFYDTYKNRQARLLAEEAIRKEVKHVST